MCCVTQQAFDQLTKEAEGTTPPMPITPFENTYQVASTKETAEKYGNPKMLELVAKASNGPSHPRSPSAASARTATSACGAPTTRPKFVSSEGQYSDLDGLCGLHEWASAPNRCRSTSTRPTRTTRSCSRPTR